MGKWGFATDPYEMARMIIEHIDKKRKALGIDKTRERQLMSMADRRSLDSAA
jgi:anaerobic carbon-monoxide dehydrogenase catalytic subunit